MAHILIPTDFSDNSMHAAEYAVRIFGKGGNRYTLLHAYADAVLADPMVMSVNEEIIRSREENLGGFRDRFVRTTGAEGVAKELVLESSSGAINEFAEEEETDIVVLGNTGQGGATLFGSNTTDVIKRSHVPVLAVPNSASFEPLERILLADDHDEADPGALAIVRRIALLTGAEVLVTHVHMAVPDGAGHWTDDAYITALAGVRHSFREVRGMDIVEGLERAARRKHVEMIAVLHRHIGLIGRLFHSSTAKELALHADRPLLVLQERS